MIKAMQSSAMKTSGYARFKEALYQSNCQKCELHKGRTQIVVDRGNPEANVMIIGEGPGETEDLQGKAFIGRAGRLLDAMFLDVGFDTNKDALIANVVKCRPPGNRAPKPDEVAECIGFLKKQIELVKPDFILLLGLTALRHITGQKKQLPMKDQVGKLFALADYPEAQFFALYHPAYILRDPRKKPLMMDHLKLFMDIKKKGF